MPKLETPPLQSHQSVHASIPGALAVAASPAAQLFDQDDWSWHRNPAAAIRSGGTISKLKHPMMQKRYP